MIQWVDLGTGFAVDPKYIKSVSVIPPTRPNTIRPYKEELSWKVIVVESNKNTRCIVAYYSEESEAIAHVGQIAKLMREREEL